MLGTLLGDQPDPSQHLTILLNLDLLLVAFPPLLHYLATQFGGGLSSYRLPYLVFAGTELPSPIWESGIGTPILLPAEASLLSMSAGNKIRTCIFCT